MRKKRVPAITAALLGAAVVARIVVPKPGQMVQPARVADLRRDEWWLEA